MQKGFFKKTMLLTLLRRKKGYDKLAQVFHIFLGEGIFFNRHSLTDLFDPCLW